MCHGINTGKEYIFISYRDIVIASIFGGGTDIPMGIRKVRIKEWLCLIGIGAVCLALFLFMKYAPCIFAFLVLAVMAAIIYKVSCIG